MPWRAFSMRILFILTIIFTVSCSSKKLQNEVPNRLPAALNKEAWRVNVGECFSKARRTCAKKYPYSKLKKKWSEFEYQFLNKRNKIHILYNDCISKKSLICTKLYGNKESIQRFTRLNENLNTEGQLAEVNGNTFWGNLKIPFMDLRPEEIKRVWQTVHLIKKTYIKVRDNVFYGLGFAKDKSLDSMHGFGVSASGTALVGIGGALQYEAVIHNRKMALFCAPGITAQSDIGISADVGVFKTLGCKDNEDYRGKFLTFAAGISSETIGLPFNVGANYSLGLGVSEFLKALAEAKESGRLELGELAKETAEFGLKASGLLRDKNFPMHQQFSYLVLSKMIALSLGEKDVLNEFNNDLKEVEEFVKNDGLDKVWKIKPLAHHIKSYLKFILLAEQIYGMNLPNFKLVVEEMAKAISSCDAIGLTGGLSLTLSPVNIGAILYQYTMLTEVNLDDVFYLAGFAPRTLLTLDLSAKQRERFMKAVAGILRVVPDLWSNQCAAEAVDKFHGDGINLWKILSN